MSEQAFASIIKNADTHDEEERSFAKTIQENFMGERVDTMQTPMLI